MSTASDCANHLFLSERRFRELLDEGVIDRQDRGSYDLDIVREQYITHIREIASGRVGSEGSDDLAAEKTRLTREQADAQEMKNATQRAELLPRKDVHTAISGAFARVRARLGAIAAKTAPLVYGANTIAEAKDIITNAVNEALAELSATQVVGRMDADGGTGDDSRSTGLVGEFDTAAEADGERMGGRRKAT